MTTLNTKQLAGNISAATYYSRMETAERKHDAKQMPYVFLTAGQISEAFFAATQLPERKQSLYCCYREVV
jgi:hypothetical protein